MNVRVRNRTQGELNLPLIYLIIFGTLALAGFLLYHMHAVPVLLCPFKELTGYPCPTCGTTRVVLSIYRLDLVSALRFNPGLMAFFGALSLWFLYGLMMQLTGRALTVELTRREGRALRGGLLILFLLNWFYLWLTGV